MKTLILWCSLIVAPIVGFAQVPSMTEYFKWKAIPVAVTESDIIQLEPFKVLSERTDFLSPQTFRELERVVGGTILHVSDVHPDAVSLTVLPESPKLGSLFDNTLSPELWVKLHGGIHIGGATFFIHSGISWRIDQWTEFICPLFQGPIHGTGFGLRRRF